MEACFALLESTVPEYDRLGVVREPGGHGPRGRRAVEHLRVERRPVDGDRRERGQRLRAAVRGDGAAGARRRPALRRTWRAARTRRRSRGDRRRVGGRAHAARDRPDPQRGGRDLRADLHDRRHLRGPAVPGPRDARHPRGPGVRRVPRPGIVPKLSETPGRGALVGHVGGGQPQPGGLRRAARPLRDEELDRAYAAGASCEGHDLRRRAARRAPERAQSALEPGTRAELVNRWRPRRACLGSRRSASSTRARAADGRRRGGGRRDRAARRRRLRRLVPQRARATTACARPRSTRCTSPSPRPRRSTAATRTRRRGVASSRRARSSSAPRGRHPRHRHDRRAFGCPFEGAVDPGARAGFAERFAGGGRRDRARRHDRRRRPATGAGARRRAVGLGRPARASTCTTRATRARERLRALEAGATVLDASVGGIGGCPFAPRRRGTSAPRISCTCSTARASRPGSTSTRSSPSPSWLEGRLGRQLHGQVYRAGAFAPMAG